MNRFEKLAYAASLLVIASPALAGEGTFVQTPAPVVGLGIGGVVLIGAGYRALKRRINR
jgi:hypothetical protein